MSQTRESTLLRCDFRPALVKLCGLVYIAIRAGIYPQSESKNALYTHAITRPPVSSGASPSPPSLGNSRVAYLLSTPVTFSPLPPHLLTSPPLTADACTCHR